MLNNNNKVKVLFKYKNSIFLFINGRYIEKEKIEKRYTKKKFIKRGYKNIHKIYRKKK